MIKINIKKILLCAAVVLGCFSAKAQIVIGSDTLGPIKGALLELKDHASSVNDSSSSSIGGLVLPRVKLVDKNTLEPFIKKTDSEWTSKNQDLTRIDHIGLMVYNLADNGNNFQQGIYIWTADGWRQLEIASGYIYAPSCNLPWNEKSFNIYDVYKENFKPTDMSHYVSSKGTGAAAMVDLPDFAQAEDFYYVVTDYSSNALTINSISEKGVMSYQKNNSLPVPPEDAYVNVIMIRK